MAFLTGKDAIGSNTMKQISIDTFLHWSAFREMRGYTHLDNKFIQEKVEISHT
jgi:hypothetical protein